MAIPNLGGGGEYGSADDPEAFRWLIAYSPYHRVVEGTCYPATLLTTGEEVGGARPARTARYGAGVGALHSSVSH